MTGPTTRFVADFIGTTNLLHGTVESLEDGFALVRLESGDRLPHRPPGPRRAARSSTSASAPRPSPSWPTAAPTERTARCRLPSSRSAYLGSAVQYLVRTTGGVALTVLTAKNAERLTAEQAVVLDWPPDEALVLGDRPVELEETG